LFELGGFKKLTKEKVDSVSACLIYESWVIDQN
ncbi:MAG: putative Holliday junction resolvase, partial [Glaciecola sp.]